MLQIAARGIVPPAVVAVLFLAAAWRPWLRSGPGPGPGTSWAAPLALGLGYAAGHVATHGWPPLALDVGIKQGLFYVAVAGAFFGLYESVRRPAWGVRAVLSVAAPFYLLDFMRRYHWEGMEAVGWTTVLAGSLLAGWLALDALAERLPGGALPIAWTATATLASASLMVTRSATLAQLAGCLATVLGVAAVVGLRRSSFTLARGGVSVFALLMAGLLWAGHYSSELSGLAAVGLGLSPVMPWLALAPGLSRQRGWRRGALVVALAILPAALALGLELAGRPADDPYY